MTRRKSLRKKLAMFRGFFWFITVIAFFTLVIYGFLANNYRCFTVANLIGFLYFAFTAFTVKGRTERIESVMLLLIFLFFTIYYW